MSTRVIVQDTTTRPFPRRILVMLRPAFSLIELLVVIAVIVLLISILLPALRHARDAAYTVKEMAVCQQLLTAYHTYATDNRERVLPPVAEYWWVWHQDHVGTVGKHQPAPMPTYSETGDRLYYLTAQPYGWRLAPYVGHAFDVLVNDKSRLSQVRQLERGPSSKRSDVFERVLTWHTSFAMNNDTDVEFVHQKFAGDHLNGAGSHGGIRLTSDVVLTDKYMLFATARAYTNEGDPNVIPNGQTPAVVNGYYQVLSPFKDGRPARYFASAATAWNAKRPPRDYGYLDLRHNKQGIVGAFDGHTELLGLDKLRDMKRWSNKAEDWNLTIK